MPSNMKISEAYHPQDRERFQNSLWTQHGLTSHPSTSILRSAPPDAASLKCRLFWESEKKSLELWPHVVHIYLGCHRIHVILLHMSDISVCGWVKTLFYHILPYSEGNEHRSIPAIWRFMCWPVALLAFLLDQNHHFNPKFAAKWSVVTYNVYIYTYILVEATKKKYYLFNPSLQPSEQMIKMWNGVHHNDYIDWFKGKSTGNHGFNHQI